MKEGAVCLTPLLIAEGEIVPQQGIIPVGEQKWRD